ncbi:hypothetical protein Btru_038875 [Bulinus truncatus]|nr:hypothetical protein Btru_038875 [Bulinus truncatus]
MSLDRFPIFSWLVALVIVFSVMHMCSAAGLKKFVLAGNSGGNNTNTSSVVSKPMSNDQPLEVSHFSGEDCKSFVTTWDNSDLPGEVRNLTGQPADEPMDVRVSFVRNDMGNGSKLRVVWEYPQSALRRPKGFLVTSEAYRMNIIECYIAIINESSTVFMDEAPLYYDLMEDLIPNEDYMVGVFSIPPPLARATMLTKDYSLVRTGYAMPSGGGGGGGGNSSSTSSWSPHLAIRRLSDPSSVEVRFTENKKLHPDRKYSITLVRIKDETDEEKKEIIKEVDDSCRSTESDEECIIVLNNIYNAFSVAVRAVDAKCVPECMSTISDMFPMMPEPLKTTMREPTMSHPLTSTELQEESTTVTTGTITTQIVNTAPAASYETETAAHTTFLTSTQEQEDSSTTELTLDAAMAPPAKKTNNTLFGGLVGGITAAGLFTFIVVVFALMDKGKSAISS